VKALLESRRPAYVFPWEGRLTGSTRRLSAGIDIGTHSLKCAIVDVGSGHVRALYREELVVHRSNGAQVLTEDELRARVEALLTECMHDAPGGVRLVRTAVQGDDTVCRLLEFPPLQSSELEVAVPSMMRKYLPWPLEQVILRWEPVAPIVEGSRKTTVFAVAARRSLVDGLNALLSACQAEPQQVNALPLTLIRAAQQNHPPAQGRLRALLHVGFSQSMVVLTRDGMPYYVRQFWPGLRTFTETLALEMGLTWKAAERVLCEMKFHPGSGALEPMFIRWMDEVSRTLEFCRRGIGDVDDVLVSGGGSALRGVPERLGAELDRPVMADWWDSLVPVEPRYPAAEAGMFMPAVGMALQG
jgi:type IV pilus assembly protein PilM